MKNTHTWSGHLLGKYCKVCKQSMKDFSKYPRICPSKNQDYAAWMRFAAVVFAVIGLTIYLTYKILKGVVLKW